MHLEFLELPLFRQCDILEDDEQPFEMPENLIIYSSDASPTSEVAEEDPQFIIYADAELLDDDDYCGYHGTWLELNPDGSRYIPLDRLSDILDGLEPPMQIPKPNKYKIISLDIPICKGDLVYDVDILDAITRDFFKRKGYPEEETEDVNEVATDRPGYEPVSSTLWRQREEYCAKIMQRAWRLHKSGADDAKNIPPGL